MRTIASGVRPYISVEEMKREAFVCVCDNLKAKKVGPIKSHGMILCSDDRAKGNIELVRPPPGSKLGERINLEGNPLGEKFTQDFKADLKGKKLKKALSRTMKLTKSNSNCEATYNGVKMVT